MKRAAIIFILALSMIMNSNVKESYGLRKIHEEFSEYSMKCLNYNVCGRVNIRGGCDTKEDFENMVCGLLRFMNISEKDASVVYDESSGKASMTGHYANGKIDFILENNIGASQSTAGCTMIVDITQYGSMENIYDIGKRVSAFLKQFDCEPDMNFCITGYIPGRISDSGREKIMDGFMEALRAKKIDSISSEGLMSVCGYSDILENSVAYRSSLMNVNIGSRYDSFDNITCFLIGSPVINIEY